MALPTTSESRVQNTILATTLADISPTIMNNAIDSHPLVSIMFGKLSDAMFGAIPMNGRAKRYGTGESIEVRVQLSQSDAARRLSSGYSTFSRDTQDTARTSRANWKYYGNSIIISGAEKRNNAGDAQIANLLTYKTTEAVQALVDLVAQDCYNGAAQTDGITGLDAVIDAGSGTYDSLQGYAGSTHQNWNSRGVSAKGTAGGSISFTGGSFATTGVSNWILTHMGASEGAIQPDFAITTEAVYTYYEGSLAPEIRYNNVKVGDGSFQTLQFKGKPVFHDSYATSGVTYFVNTQYCWAQVSRGADFTVTALQEQDFQDVFSAKVLFQGNLVSNARKYQNKVDSQTA